MQRKPLKLTRARQRNIGISKVSQSNLRTATEKLAHFWVNDQMPSGIICIFILSGILFVCPSLTFAATSSTEEPRSILETISSTIGTLGPPFLAYLILRALTVHWVRHFMMKRAPHVSPIDETPDAIEAPIIPPSAAEPHFVEFDGAKGILLNAVHQDRLERTLDTGLQTWKTFWKSLFLFAFVSCVLFVILKGSNSVQEPSAQLNVPTQAAPVVPGNPPDTLSDQVPAGPLADVGHKLLLTVFPFVLAFVGLFLILMAWTRYCFLGRVPILVSVGGWSFLSGLWMVVGLVLGVPFYLYLLPAVCSIPITLWDYIRIHRLSRAVGNLKLLVLRVFGADRNTAFVFGELMQKWRFIGSFLTIVDPSYIRYQFSHSSRENRFMLSRFTSIYGFVIAAMTSVLSLLMFFASPGPLKSAWTSLSETQREEMLGILAWLTLIPLAILPIFITVRHRFVQSLEKLNRRVQSIRNRGVGWGGVFKGFPMYCFDNIWKRAIDLLLGVSDLVLMDLRGFSPSRQGCEYEIGVLIDRFPIQRVIFLVDEGSSKEGVYQVMRQRWRHMSAESPNRGLQRPVIKVYTPGDHDERDIPRILALLAASVVKEGERADSLVSFEGPLPGVSTATEGTRTRSISHQILARIREYLDMLMVTPKYVRVIVPLVLTAVFVVAAIRIGPALDAYQAFTNPAVYNPIPTAKPPNRSVDTLRDGVAVVVLNDLKIEARASVKEETFAYQGKEYFDSIEVVLDLMGDDAVKAYRYGNVKIKSATTDHGKTLVLRRSFNQNSPSGLVVVDRSQSRPFFNRQPDHPRNGLRLELEFLNIEGLTRIDKLAGTVTLQAVHPDQTVTFENIGSPQSERSLKPLSHPKLNAISALVFTVYNSESFHVFIMGQDLGDLDIRVVNSHGEMVPSRSYSKGPGRIEFEYPISKLAGARLEFILGFKTTEVPFELTHLGIQR